ncbi:hypothetical protein D3C83_124400 [compost metagenome]
MAAGVIEAQPQEAQMLAVQMVFTTTCWLSFERLLPGRGDLQQADAGFAAFVTLTLVAPYVSRESRPYLDYLRSKYLG